MCRYRFRGGPGWQRLVSTEDLIKGCGELVNAEEGNLERDNLDEYFAERSLEVVRYMLVSYSGNGTLGTHGVTVASD